MKHLAALFVMLSAGSLYAADLPPHAHVISGGWIECDRGYLMRANACVSEAQQRADKVEVSNLPSAGEGSSSGRACPSGGCGPAPQSNAPTRRSPRPEWEWEGNNPGGGTTYTRSVGGGRQVVTMSWQW